MGFYRKFMAFELASILSLSPLTLTSAQANTHSADGGKPNELFSDGTPFLVHNEFSCDGTPFLIELRMEAHRPNEIDKVFSASSTNLGCLTKTNAPQMPLQMEDYQHFGAFDFGFNGQSTVLPGGIITFKGDLFGAYSVHHLDVPQQNAFPHQITSIPHQLPSLPVQTDFVGATIPGRISLATIGKVPVRLIDGKIRQFSQTIWENGSGLGKLTLTVSPIPAG